MPSPSRRPSGSKPRTPPRDDRPDLLDQLRKALRQAEDAGRSHYALAKEAGCHRIQIGRFMADPDADLKGSTIAGLCRALRLELRTTGRASRAA